MKLVFYSVVLNHHQAPLADEFYRQLGEEYCFVELSKLGDNKGAVEDYSQRPYLIRAWETETDYIHAKELACQAECCVFSGIQSLPFLKMRMERGLLSFDMGERWLKRGIINLLSPAIFRMYFAYHLGGWKHKPLYKLCMGAFASGDHGRLGMYNGKCYKWGYFTTVPDEPEVRDNVLRTYNDGTVVRLMWCARFLKLKHPEMPVLLANRLKQEGFSFVIDFFGDGDEFGSTRQMAESMGLMDVVKFYGSVSNSQVLEAMRNHDILLFTSNQLEGWGAVVNEALSNGCVVVGSDAVGSVPYLIEDGVNGFRFKSGDLESLYARVKWLIDNPTPLREMQNMSSCIMHDLWSPRNAAISLLHLIESLQHSTEPSIEKGPCSIAQCT